MINALLYVRPETPDENGIPIPDVPGTWAINHEDGPWYSARKSDGTFCHVARVSEGANVGEGHYVVFGEPELLADLPTAEGDMRSIWAAQSPGFILRRWPVWRFTGTVDGEGVADHVMRLRNEGDPLLPTSLPWNLTVDGRAVVVTSISRPAWDGTIVGYLHNERVEEVHE